MADIPARMKQIIGTIAQWTDDNIVIGNGEFALERTDVGGIKVKVGNGVDAYLDLPYMTTGFGDESYSWGTPSRSYGIVFLAPDHPIMVSHISRCQANDGLTEIYVDGALVAQASNAGNGALMYTLSVVVPAGSTYQINQTNLDSSVWSEMRADY